MNSLERVLKTIRHEEPDRVPLNIWNFRPEVQKPVIEKYGSLEKFNETFGIDIVWPATPPPCPHNPQYLEELMNLDPYDIKAEDFLDPDDPSIYKDVEEALRRYKGDKAIFVHIWGVVESIYGYSGIEPTLLLMAMDPDKAKELFTLARDFSVKVVKNICSMGVDVIHITGDVGSNNSMIFSPQMWREMVKPFDTEIAQPAINAGFPLSLHSCGYFTPVLPDFIEMGFEIFHPIQESAGMDQEEIKDQFGDKITIHGGLDVRLLPTMSEKEVEKYVRKKMMALKPGGGFILNTAHVIQPDTPLNIIERAYEVANEYAAY